MTDDGYQPVDEPAKHLSVKVPTIREWVNKGYIPASTYVKVGKTYRFNIPEVVAALKQEIPEPDQTEKNSPVQLEFDFDSEEDL